MDITIEYLHDGEEKTVNVEGVTRIEEVSGGGDYHELHVYTGADDLTIYAHGELI